MNDDGVEQLLELFVGYSTTKDLHRLRLLSPDLDRAIQLRVARDGHLRSPKDTEPVLRGPLPLTPENLQAVMIILERYMNENDYETDVAHALALHFLFNGACGCENELASIVLLSFLIQTSMPVLLERQMRFITNNYIMPAADEEQTAPALNSDVLQAVFLKPSSYAEGLFKQIRGASRSCFNVAACLMVQAMEKSSYDCARLLLAQPPFTCSLPLGCYMEMQRTCAQALLSLYAKQQADPRVTLFHMDDEFAAQKLLPIVNGDALRPFDQLLGVFSLIEKRIRLRERHAARLEEEEAGEKDTADAALLRADPELRIERAHALLENEKRLKSHVETALVAIRNALLPLVDSADDTGYLKHILDVIRSPQTAGGVVGVKPSADADILLFQPPPSKEKADKDDDVDDKVPAPAAPTPDLSLRFGQEVLKHMLLENKMTPVGGVVWADIAAIQALYRYYDLRVMPGVDGAFETLKETYKAVAVEKQAQRDAAKRNFAESVQKVTAKSYWGEE